MRISVTTTCSRSCAVNDMAPPAPSRPAAGVAEEFHIAGLATRQLTARAGEVMDQLPADTQARSA